MAGTVQNVLKRTLHVFECATTYVYSGMFIRKGIKGYLPVSFYRRPIAGDDAPKSLIAESLSQMPYIEKMLEPPPVIALIQSPRRLDSSSQQSACLSEDCSVSSGFWASKMS